MRDSVTEIQHAAERAASLTRQLLAFSRRQTLESAPVDLNVVARDMVALLARVLGGEIEVLAETRPEPVTVATDRSQLEQALLNLAVNARDAMPEGGRLVLSVSQRDTDNGPVGVMRVADTGSGIPPEVQAHIFDPFFTTKEVGQGSGLGLAMVYGFVQQSGATITLRHDDRRGDDVRADFPGGGGAEAGRDGRVLEKIAVACGLANIYLTVRQNIWCWPVGVVMVSLYIYIFFDAKLYSDAGLNVFFLVMQFYGWYHWTRGGVDHSRSLVGGDAADREASGPGRSAAC